MKKLFGLFIISSVMLLTSISDANGWQCPCQVTKSQLEPPNTYGCVGAPEEGDNCTCSAYCSGELF